MDQPSPQTPETPQPPDEAWRRFTLLDLLILFTGHESGLGIMKWSGTLESRLHESLFGIVLLFWLFLMFGSMISIPLIYGVQFLSRRRSIALTPGEQFGVFNIVTWGATFLCLLSGFNPPPMLQFIINLAMFLYIFICGIGSIIFVIKLFSSKKKAPCLWLDLYGYFQFVVTIGIVISYILVMMSLPLDKMG
jgi:hypothetical protein